MLGFGRSDLEKGLDAFAAQRWRQARRLLEEAWAREEKSADCAYHLGLLYWRGLGGERDVKAAGARFALAAEKGHAAAQTACGVALRSGVGVAQNLEAARALFRSATGAGDCEAMVALATMSAPEEARALLLRAAEKGYAPAMRCLADLIHKQEPVEALAWLYAATATRADEAARKRAAALARDMSAREIAEAQRTGRAYAGNIARGSART